MCEIILRENNCKLYLLIKKDLWFELYGRMDEKCQPTIEQTIMMSGVTHS